MSLLVWGTYIVRTGILRIYGGDLRRILPPQRARPRWRAFFAGLGVTALIQSSNATALMIASFAGQGLIATAPALAVMLGADRRDGADDAGVLVRPALAVAIASSSSA